MVLPTKPDASEELSQEDLATVAGGATFLKFDFKTVFTTK
jgi:hypothetical protein